MITMIVMIQNTREEQILKAAFEQFGVKVVLSKPTYQNYVLILQYIPDIVFMELPHICTEQLAFAKRLRGYKRTKLVPIVGYGDKIDEMVKRGISQSGFSRYIERPLKFSSLLIMFGRLLKSQGKSFDAPPVISDKEKDLDLIINSDALPMQKIEAMTRHVSALLAFPFTVTKVLQITQNEKSGAQTLAHAIVSDPSISTHILKVANSVFFASTNHRINSVKDAIVRIGFNETRKIVMSMHVIKLFEKTNKNSGFDRVDFWYHSIAVGLISEKIARQLGDMNVEIAFLAGLLHDLGIMLLDEYLTPVFDRALELTARKGAHFIDVQKELFNVTHNDLISSLFPFWKIPQEITDAILYQFKVDEFNGEFDTLGKKLTLCVAIGSILAKSLHIGRECDEFIYPISNELMQKARFPSGFGKSFISQIYDDLAMYQSFLGLEKRTFTCEVCGIEAPEKFSIAFFSPDVSIFIPEETHTRNIGFKTIRVSALSQIDKDVSCIVIWDLQGTMTFNNVELFGVKKDGVVMVSTPIAPIVFIGSTAEKPAGLPETFTYLTSSLDLRIFDMTIGRLIGHLSESVSDEYNATIDQNISSEAGTE